MVMTSDFANLFILDWVRGGALSPVTDYQIAIPRELRLARDICHHAIRVLPTEYLPQCYRGSVSQRAYYNMQQGSSNPLPKISMICSINLS